MALLFKLSLRQLVQSSQVLTLDGWDDVLAANVETVEHSCELPGRKTISRICVCQLFIEIAMATTSIRPYQRRASGPMERLTSGSNAFPFCSLSRQAVVPFSSSVSGSRCSWTPLRSRRLYRRSHRV